MEIFQADTSRDPGKPDLRPLPEEPPEDPTHHGWKWGLRDWFWSGIRQELHVFTGGAPNYTDRHYEMGHTPLEVLEKRARFRGLGFPSDEALEWFRAGLRAASFSIGGGGEIRFQGPEGLPDFFLEKAMGFAVRRADRALDLYGEETASVDRDLPELDEPSPDAPEGEPEDSGSSAQEPPEQAPRQGRLF